MAVINLGRSLGHGLTPDLTKRKRGGVWTAADEAKHPRDHRGRFTEAFGGGQGAVEQLLASLVREHKAEKTKLGQSIMAMLGTPGDSGTADRGGTPNPAKPLRAKAPVKAIPADVAQRVEAIRKRPMPSDIPYLEAELPKLTVAQLVEVAGPNTILASRDKKGKVRDLVSHLTGRVQSEAITHRVGDSGLMDSTYVGNRRALQEEFKRRIKLAEERGDRDEYAALIAGFGVSGTGPGLPPEKKTTVPKPDAGAIANAKADERRAQTAHVEELRANLKRQYGDDPDSWPDARQDREVDEYYNAEEKLRQMRRGLVEPAKPNPAKPLKGRLETAGMQGADANMDRLARKLQGAKTAEEGRELVAGLKVAELKALAGALGIRGSQSNKKAWQDTIIDHAVQNRLNSQAIRSLGDPVDKPAAPAGPRYSDRPQLANHWGTGGGDVSYHPDGEIGSTISHLSDDERRLDVDGDRLDNALGLLVTQSIRGQLHSSELPARLRGMAGKLPEGRARRAVERTADDLEVGSGAEPIRFGTRTPLPLRRLAEQLARVRPDRFNGNLELAGLQRVIDDFAAGRVGGRRFESAVENATFNRRHESQEGKFDVDRAAQDALDMLDEMRRANPKAFYPPDQGGPSAPEPEPFTLDEMRRRRRVRFLEDSLKDTTTRIRPETRAAYEAELAELRSR